MSTLYLKMLANKWLTTKETWHKEEGEDSTYSFVGEGKENFRMRKVKCDIFPVGIPYHFVYLKRFFFLLIKTISEINLLLFTIQNFYILPIKVMIQINSMIGDNGRWIRLFINILHIFRNFWFPIASLVDIRNVTIMTWNFINRPDMTFFPENPNPWW